METVTGENLILHSKDCVMIQVTNVSVYTSAYVPTLHSFSSGITLPLSAKRTPEKKKKTGSKNFSKHIDLCQGIVHRTIYYT